MADDLLDPIRAVIRLSRIAQQVCEEVGLNLAQYRALASTRDVGQRAKTLAEENGVSRPAVTSLTNGMVAAGLLERSPSPGDGRGVVYLATPLGLDKLKEADARLVERFTSVLGDAAPALAGLDPRVVHAALGAHPPPQTTRRKITDW